MIKLVTGNLLEASAEALVNTVNCVGVMGKGIALQFKQAFPQVFEAYEKACRRGGVRPGRMLTVETGQMMNPRYVINFPTKRHWKGRSKPEDIDAGLPVLVAELRRLGVKSVAVPPLGCRSGGLDWAVVRPRIEAALAAVPELDVQLFEPQGAPAPDTIKVATAKPKMTRARALFVRLIEQYCEPGYRLTLLEIQKLAYFLQEAGEGLKLNFTKQQYGPYAENLHFVLQRIEGHFIRGYGDRSRDAQIYLLPEGRGGATAYLEGDTEAEARLERVARLLDGFETPFGLELLSSVHWVATKDAAPAVTAEQAVEKVHFWSDCKRTMFEPRHIQIAWFRLKEERWI
jgi:O-acetyl-ADP-ribose deacetylase (regulator of RNase III)